MACSWKSVAIVLLLPFMLVGLVIALALGIVWAAIGFCFERSVVVGITLIGTLAGLAATDGGAKLISVSRPPGYSAIVWDVAIVAAALLAISTTVAGAAKHRRTALAVAAACTFISSVYVFAKAGLYTGAWSHSQVAIMVISSVGPCVQLLGLARVWRHASHRLIPYWQRKILDKVLSDRVGYTHRLVAGMMTVEFYAKGDARAQQAAGSDGSGAGAMPAPPSQTIDNRPVLVISHGYMSGVCMHIHNFEPFVHAGYRVIAIDWIGCTGSERPAFTPTTTQETQDWFLGYFEQWRIAMGIERMVLFGHSMGGYLSACYALRHPQRIQHLVLVSPGGIPPDPAVDRKAATGGMVPSDPKTSPTPRPIPRWLWGTVSCLWELNVTPGDLLRFLGPCGPCIARGGVNRRFARLVQSKSLDHIVPEMGMYYYHGVGGDGSGEYAMKYIFAPGARARVPVGPRLVAAAAEGRIRFPVLFTYGGTHDWMTASAGKAVAQQLRSYGLRSRCELVSPGGHHLYLESPDTFNAIVLQDVGQTVAMEAAAAASHGSLGTGALHAQDVHPKAHGGTSADSALRRRTSGTALEASQ